MKVIIDDRISELGPDDMADCFAGMDNHCQARFFSRLGEIVNKWKTPFCFQAHMISDSEMLTNEGRYFMHILGEYSEKIDRSSSGSD